MKAALRLELMLSKSGSLQVIRAMPAVRFRTICWAAMCIRCRSGSKLKSCKTELCKVQNNDAFEIDKIS